MAAQRRVGSEESWTTALTSEPETPQPLNPKPFRIEGLGVSDSDKYPSSVAPWSMARRVAQRKSLNPKPLPYMPSCLASHVLKLFRAPAGVHEC